MWNETNPTTLYLGTTWELITAGKYIQSGNISLSTGGSNSVSISKVNLPSIKLKVDSFSLTQPAHTHEIGAGGDDNSSHAYVDIVATKIKSIKTSAAGGESTGTATPNTETLGSGTPLNIQPEYITLKFWKRTS